MQSKVDSLNRLLNRQVLVTCLATAFLLQTGCKEETINRRTNSGSYAQNQSDEQKPSGDKSGQAAQNGTRAIENAGFGLALVSADQLGKRIDLCVGNGHRIIKGEQIVNHPEADSSAFLLSNVYSPGDDVVEKLKPLIDGNEEGQRAGVRPSAPSIRYFSNVQEIARIVADSCARTIDRDEDDEAVDMCSCRETRQARAMFGRCLSAYSQDSEEVRSLLLDFQLQCQTSVRAAIASMIASFAFTVQH